MAKDDNQVTLSEQLSDILEDYTLWYNAVLKCAFYSSDTSQNVNGGALSNFEEWAKRAKLSGEFENTSLERVLSIHKKISAYSLEFIKLESSEDVPDLDVFDEFSNMFADFTGRARRLERDSEVADGGVHAMTGLRSMSVFESDVAREIERRNRSGTPFCLALVKVDSFSSSTDDVSLLNRYQPEIVEVVKDSLRTYDDGYFKKDGAYFLCLKNAHFPGACAVVNRINRQLEKVETSNGVSLSVSAAIIAEDFFVNSIKDVAAGLHDSLLVEKAERKSIRQYKEVSALQKYMAGVEG